MDDLLKRFGVLERDVSDLKVQVAGIAAQLPHLATKAEVGDLKAAISDTKALISDAKTSIVQWVVGTTIAVAGIAFTIAKFVH